jgi:hypothetical protein
MAAENGSDRNYSAVDALSCKIPMAIPVFEVSEVS